MFISYSGLSIFRENSLRLVEYFDPKLEEQYSETVLTTLEEVKDVLFIKAEYPGSVIILNLEISVDPNMTVLETEK